MGNRLPPSRWLQMPRGVDTPHSHCFPGLRLYPSLRFTWCPCLGLLACQVSGLWLFFDFCLPLPLPTLCAKEAITGGRPRWEGLCLQWYQRLLGISDHMVLPCAPSSLPPSFLFVTTKCLLHFSYMLSQQFSLVVHVHLNLHIQVSMTFLNKVPSLRLDYDSVVPLKEEHTQGH